MLVYTVENSQTTFATKNSLRAAKVYADWILSRGEYCYITKRRLMLHSDLRGDTASGQPEDLFDGSFRSVKIYQKQKNKWQ